MMKKTIVLAALVAIAGVAIPKLQTVQAASTNQSNFIQSLAQKLGISPDKITTAYSDIQSDRNQSRLNQLVTDGKITTAQRDLIFAKQKELEARRVQERKDLESWATTNGIDLHYLMGFGGRRMGHQVFP